MKTKLTKIIRLAKTAKEYSLQRGKTVDVKIELDEIEILAKEILDGLTRNT